MNIGIGHTRFPDFLAITKSGYVDVVEIKKPSTPLLQFDKGRGLYFWSKELSLAISQVEHYLVLCSEFRLAIAEQLKAAYGLDASVVRPRGLIISGNTQLLEHQRKKDAFRSLSQTVSQVRVVGYDEC